MVKGQTANLASILQRAGSNQLDLYLVIIVSARRRRDLYRSGSELTLVG